MLVLPAATESAEAEGWRDHKALAPVGRLAVLVAQHFLNRRHSDAFGANRSRLLVEDFLHAGNAAYFTQRGKYNLVIWILSQSGCQMPGLPRKVRMQEENTYRMCNPESKKDWKTAASLFERYAQFVAAKISD